MLRIAPVLLLALFGLAGCTLPEDDTEKGPPRDEYGRTEQDAAKYAAAVEARRLLPGMHKGEIRAVMKGDPEKVSRQNRGESTYTVWEYRSRSLDLFLDGDGYLVFWRAPY